VVGVLTGRKLDGGRSTGGKDGKWREEYLHNSWKEETDRKPDSWREEF
jgi:hypothetical protein